MALIKCEECGKEISDEAKICPNCGAKTKKTKEHNKTLKISVIIVLVLSILMAIYYNMPINNYKREAKSITNLYLEGKYSSSEAEKKLKYLANEVDKIYKENNNTNYMLLSSKISNISTEIYLYSIDGKYEHESYIKQKLKEL